MEVAGAKVKARERKKKKKKVLDFLYFSVETGLCVHPVIEILPNMDKKGFIFQNLFALLWKRMLRYSLQKLKSYLEPQRDVAPMVKLKKNHIDFLKTEMLEV